MDELIKDFNLDELEKELSDIIEDEEQQERFVIVREGMVKLTGGFMEAAVLSSMISWQRTVNRMDKKVFDQIKESLENGNRVQAEKLKKKLHYGWFYKPAKEMREEMFNAASERTINRIFERLEEMKFIEGKQLPNFDRKKYYKVNIAHIREKLAKLGYNLDGYKLSKVESKKNPENTPKRQNDGWENPHEITKRQIDGWKRQNDDSIRQNDDCKRQNDGAITLDYSLPTTSLHDSFTTGMYVGSEPNNPVKTFERAYRLTRYAVKELNRLMNTYGPFLVDEAIKRAIKNESTKPISYTEGVLEKWSAAGVQTLEDIEAYEENFRKQQQKKKEQRKSTGQGKSSSSDLPEMLKQHEGEQDQKELVDPEDKDRKIAELRAKIEQMSQRHKTPVF
ncbi:DnaD domain protein [Thermoactinomyces sp. CICC 10521]|uniref:DnaD domain-containing protein n=1 Tax=Thermoactinomyces sp. CICC 10521 TaxID=2767426 RepID=UPI0018DE0E5B|nr:DnaD domain protein [Thermoactinomyces sp. CICC 10521]MBH8608925.1 DnaD domain protein [Thermoactinomyces sp. CICC 10521]